MSESHSPVSLQLASRLVENLTLKSVPQEGVPHSSDVAEGLAATVLKFLAAFESISLPDSESGTADSIRFYLKSDADRFPSNSNGRFDELHQKMASLLKDSALRNQILLLLLSVSRQRAKEKTRKGTPCLDATTPSLSTSLHSTSQKEMSASAMDGQVNATKPAKTNVSVRSRKQVDSSTIPWQGVASTPETSHESLLVRDVLYICQGIMSLLHVLLEMISGVMSVGIDGKHVRFSTPSSATEFVLIDPSISLSDPMRKLILRLCEVGFLFKKVDAFSSTSQHSMESDPSILQSEAGMDIDRGIANQHGCFASQAFSYAVSKELSEYYRLMAVLESRASGQLEESSPQSKESTSEGPLTLRRLHVWLMEAARKMRILAVLVDSISHLKGGALASALYTHSRTGDPFAHKFIMRLLRKVSVPMFSMIKTWVFEGEFADPHNEFFIVKNADCSRTTLDKRLDWWRTGYTLNEKMLPAFFSPALARKILRAGKSINFLRSRCGDVEWVQEQAATSEVTEVVSYANLETLQTLVEKASSKVDARLMQIVTQKFLLPLHFEALRRYILLGQGDFVQSLLDCLKPELDKEMSKVSEAAVMGCIRTAIHSSNALYDDEDVQDRLCMKKAETFTTQVGWDVFVLNYRIDAASPLAAVIPPATMIEYHKVFRLLWKLKKTESNLNECWNGLRSASRSAGRPGLGVGRRLHALLLLALSVRSKISHFCINFQYYIMFEVLEGAWKEFTASADKATDLDALIAAHEAYLGVILSKCLLDNSHIADSLRSLLTDYFRLVEGLTKMVAKLVTDTEQILHLLYARLQGVAEPKHWRTDSRPEMEDVPLENYMEMKNNFAAVLEKYDMFLGAFTERVGSEAHIDLRFLMFRLDFEETGNRHDVDAEAMISEEVMQE